MEASRRLFDGATAAATLRTHKIADPQVRALLRQRMPHLHIFQTPGTFPHDAAVGGALPVVYCNKCVTCNVGLVVSKPRTLIRDEFRKSVPKEEDLPLNVVEDQRMTEADYGFALEETRCLVVSHELKGSFCSSDNARRNFDPHWRIQEVPDVDKEYALYSVDTRRYFKTLRRCASIWYTRKRLSRRSRTTAAAERTSTPEAASIPRSEPSIVESNFRRQGIITSLEPAGLVW